MISLATSINSLMTFGIPRVSQRVLVMLYKVISTLYGESYCWSFGTSSRERVRGVSDPAPPRAGLSASELEAKS